MHPFLFYSLHFLLNKSRKIPLIILGGFTQQIFIKITSHNHYMQGDFIFVILDNKYI